MKKKHVIAIIVMLLMILVAIPLGIDNSIDELKKTADSHYYYDSTGYAIYEGVDKRVESAEQLIKVANKYEADHTELIPLIEELERTAKELDYTYDVLEEEAKNRELDVPAQALADALGRIELDEADAKYPKQIMAEITAEMKRLQHSSYNDHARSYNERIGGFPVSVMKNLGFYDPLPVYE